MAQDFYATMKSQLAPKPKPKGPVLENYVPSWGDWLANKAADMFGSSNAGKQSITDYMRQKINPAIPLVGSQQAVRDIQGKAKEGNFREAVMDTALETMPGGGAAKAIFIGPAARSWNKAAAKEATSMLKAKEPLSKIWEKTRTGFHKVGESKRGPTYPGQLTPMQEVSSRNMLLSPELMAGKVNPQSRARAIEESMEHPIFSEYPGIGEIPLFKEMDPGTGGSMRFLARKGQKVEGLPGVVGLTLNPTMRPAYQGLPPPKLVGTGARDKSMGGAASMQTTAEHELQHVVSQIEGWPMSNTGEMLGPSELLHLTRMPLEEAQNLPEFTLARELLGRYGAEKYPEFPRENRLGFGLYAHDVNEVLSRAAEGSTWLDEPARAALPPHERMDVKYPMQFLPNEVWERHYTDMLKGLMNP
jgi:hypothetical protein